MHSDITNGFKILYNNISNEIYFTIDNKNLITFKPGDDEYTAIFEKIKSNKVSVKDGLYFERYKTDALNSNGLIKGEFIEVVGDSEMSHNLCYKNRKFVKIPKTEFENINIFSGNLNKTFFKINELNIPSVKLKFDDEYCFYHSFIKNVELSFADVTFDIACSNISNYCCAGKVVVSAEVFFMGVDGNISQKFDQISIRTKPESIVSTQNFKINFPKNFHMTSKTNSILFKLKRIKSGFEISDEYDLNIVNTSILYTIK